MLISPSSIPPLKNPCASLVHTPLPPSPSRSRHFPPPHGRSIAPSTLEAKFFFFANAFAGVPCYFFTWNRFFVFANFRSLAVLFGRLHRVIGVLRHIFFQMLSCFLPSSFPPLLFFPFHMIHFPIFILATSVPRTPLPPSLFFPLGFPLFLLLP